MGAVITDLGRANVRSHWFIPKTDFLIHSTSSYRRTFLNDDNDDMRGNGIHFSSFSNSRVPRFALSQELDEGACIHCAGARPY
jgi:hypothetical protein